MLFSSSQKQRKKILTTKKVGANYIIIDKDIVLCSHLCNYFYKYVN